jgi:hypothetical protein
MNMVHLTDLELRLVSSALRLLLCAVEHVREDWDDADYLVLHLLAERFSAAVETFCEEHVRTDAPRPTRCK